MAMLETYNHCEGQFVIRLGIAGYFDTRVSYVVHQMPATHHVN